MYKARVILAGLTMAAAATAQAGLSVTPAVVSDYDFRGISQTATDPALQVGADFTTGSFHVGTWLSNIEWGSAYKGSTEVDLLADYTFGSDETVKFTVGAVGYLYPDMSNENTVEGFVGLSKNWFSGKLSYTNDWFNLGKAFYLEANGNFPIADTGFAVTAHLGRSMDDAWKGIEYTDYSLGVTKTLGNFTAGLKYVGSDAPELTDAQERTLYGKKNVFETEDRVILSISTTLPWAK